MAALEVVAEEVADNLEEIAMATRTLNTKSIGFFLSGAAVGFAVGMYFGYKKNKEKIRAEAFKDSEEEVAKIREHYRQKAVAAAEKPAAEVIIAERGYDRPLVAPVPGVREPERTTRGDVDYTEPEIEKPNTEWDLERELQHRLDNPDDPYVLHQEEYMGKETGYRQVAYTYFEHDDVLVGEDGEHPLPHADLIVGLNNLQFGHGTDDPDVVYVRNNERQLEMEICRVYKSFAVEILGLDVSETDEPDEDS